MPKLTDRSRKALMAARVLAVEHGLGYIGTEQILLGVAAETSGMGAKMLKILGISFDDIMEAIERCCPPTVPETAPQGQPPDALPFSPRAKRAIELAFHDMEAEKAEFVDTSNLLVGLYLENDGTAAQVLSKFVRPKPVTRVDLEKARAGVIQCDRPVVAKPGAAKLGSYKITLYVKSSQAKPSVPAVYVAGAAYVEATSLTLTMTDLGNAQVVAANVAAMHGAPLYTLSEA